MKKIVISIVAYLFICSYTAFSQVVEVEDKIKTEAVAADTIAKCWLFEGRFQLLLNQAYSSNWIGSSEPFIGLSTLDNLYLLYHKNIFSWENILDLDFGMRHTFLSKGNKSAKKDEKTSDKIDFSSQIGFKMKKDWYYGALLQINTQMINGWSDTIKTSSFMTPGYVTLSLGIIYKHSMWSWYISPVAAKLTTKIDPVFYSKEDFGVDANKKTHLSVGAFTRISFASDIHPKINLKTKLELFYDYLGEYDQMRNTTANFEMIWRFSVTEWLSITLKTALLYDYDIRFPVYDTDGTIIDGITTDHLQFQELFGLTLGYKFKLPKKK
jgi:hypothetical protein